MTGSKKIKTVDKKIKQYKAQYNLDRQTVNISALSLENIPEKDLVQEATTIRAFEYSLFCGELKMQTSIAKNRVLRIRQGS